MEIAPKRALSLIAAAMAVGCGVLAFNFVPNPNLARDAVLALEAVAAGGAAGWLLVRGARNVGFDEPASVEEATLAPIPTITAVLSLVALWSVLYGSRWGGLEPYSDDHHYLAMSADWQTTVNNL